MRNWVAWRHRLLEEAPLLGAGAGLLFPFIFFGLAIAGVGPATLPGWLALLLWVPMAIAFFLLEFITGPAPAEGLAPTGFVVLVVMLYGLSFSLCGLVFGFLLRLLTGVLRNGRRGAR